MTSNVPKLYGAAHRMRSTAHSLFEHALYGVARSVTPKRYVNLGRAARGRWESCMSEQGEAKARTCSTRALDER